MAKALRLCPLRFHAHRLRAQRLETHRLPRRECVLTTLALVLEFGLLVCEFTCNTRYIESKDFPVVGMTGVTVRTLPLKVLFAYHVM